MLIIPQLCISINHRYSTGRLVFKKTAIQATEPTVVVVVVAKVILPTKTTTTTRPSSKITLPKMSHKMFKVYWVKVIKNKSKQKEFFPHLFFAPSPSDQKWKLENRKKNPWAEQKFKLKIIKNWIVQKRSSHFQWSSTSKSGQYFDYNINSSYKNFLMRYYLKLSTTVSIKKIKKKKDLSRNFLCPSIAAIIAFKRQPVTNQSTTAFLLLLFDSIVIVKKKKKKKRSFNTNASPFQFWA